MPNIPGLYFIGSLNPWVGGPVGIKVSDAKADPIIDWYGRSAHPLVSYPARKPCDFFQQPYVIGHACGHRRCNPQAPMNAPETDAGYHSLSANAGLSI